MQRKTAYGRLTTRVHPSYRRLRICATQEAFVPSESTTASTSVWHSTSAVPARSAAETTRQFSVKLGCVWLVLSTLLNTKWPCPSCTVIRPWAVPFPKIDWVLSSCHQSTTLPRERIKNPGYRFSVDTALGRAWLNQSERQREAMVRFMTWLRSRRILPEHFYQFSLFHLNSQEMWAMVIDCWCSLRKFWPPGRRRLALYFFL